MATVDVQLVLYHTDLARVERSLHALARAAGYRRDDDSDALEITVRLGDCSAMRLLGDDVLLQWQEYFRGQLEIEYEYFAMNLGHGGAQNRLSQGGKGDYILFSNPDVLPQPSAVAHLVELLHEDPRVGIVDAKQLPLEHPKHFEPFTGLTSWCSGAFTLVRRRDFERVGGFDHETFFMYCDDVDLSWRIRLLGLDAVYQPAAVVYHSKRLDASGAVETTASERYYSAEAALLLARKWGAEELLATLIQVMSDSASDDHRNALARYRSLEHADRLPAVIPGASDVAEFVHGAYGKMRW